MVGSGAGGSAVRSADADGYIIEAGEQCQDVQGVRTIPSAVNQPGGVGVYAGCGDYDRV